MPKLDSPPLNLIHGIFFAFRLRESVPPDPSGFGTPPPGIRAAAVFMDKDTIFSGEKLQPVYLFPRTVRHSNGV
jgi:hypothetical protein